MHKKRKVRDLEEELARKTRQADEVRRAKQTEHTRMIREGCFADKPTRDTDPWVERMEGIRQRYLSEEEEWRRSKIKHDYNLFVERSCSCRRRPKKVCDLCSPTRSPASSSPSTLCSALLSPRYQSIYGRVGVRG